MGTSIFDSALSHTRRSDASEKKKKIACPLLDVFESSHVSVNRIEHTTKAHCERVVDVESGLYCLS